MCECIWCVCVFDVCVYLMCVWLGASQGSLLLRESEAKIRMQ